MRQACAVSFLFLLIAAGFLSWIPAMVPAVYCAMSVIAILFYSMDKSAAVNNRWRTKESTLHLLALLGGWPGALLAQDFLRHKTRKTSFQWVFWMTAAFNCGALAWLLIDGDIAGPGKGVMGF